MLRDDGTLSGSTGCRSFSGPYTVEGDRLNVGDLVVDLRACDEGLGAQDAAVLAIVGADPDLAIAGDTLSLRAADGGLDYRAEP